MAQNNNCQRPQKKHGIIKQDAYNLFALNFIYILLFSMLFYYKSTLSTKILQKIFRTLQ